MPESLASLVVVAASAYLAAGALFAMPFLARWVGKTDPVARQGTLGFRLIILPGTILLWPLLAARLLRGGPQPPVERNAHRDRAGAPR